MVVSWFMLPSILSQEARILVDLLLRCANFEPNRFWYIATVPYFLIVLLALQCVIATLACRCQEEYGSHHYPEYFPCKYLGINSNCSKRSCQVFENILVKLRKLSSQSHFATHDQPCFETKPLCLRKKA